MKRDAQLLYELGMLRHMQRQWHRFGGIPFANLADHHFRVAWIALVIARYEKVKNTDKLLKMALAHDIAESRTNDVDYISRQYVKRDETTGFQDMVEGTVLENEFFELYKEYEERETIEAKIVKDADQLDVDFEIQEQASNGHDLKLWLHYRDKAVMENFYTKTAKKLFKELYNTNPYDWHALSPKNRINGGDWKK